MPTISTKDIAIAIADTYSHDGNYNGDYAIGAFQDNSYHTYLDEMLYDTANYVGRQTWQM